ncbi:hypothetical protein NST02_23460 [Robertmurraya sp. FSL W8-0741]|uniref:hypothetical protein n=1 Tax=Robertmurraya sp. FSL W8-0741 TaxID=2954629 RepID=UPI0030F629DB
MNPYIVQTEYAVTNMFNLLNNEQNNLSKLKQIQSHLDKQHQILYDDFYRKDLDPDENFTEQQMMQAFTTQASFYEARLEPIHREIEKTQQLIVAQQESIKALSGAILQIAKQGISIVHGGLSNCPNGRFFNNEPIKNIIWQGRNQSMHFEEGRFNHPVVSCFQNIGIPLTNKNLAKEIINLLNWKSYKDYEADMTLLLG